MLISELNKWHWAITWDNPAPANSSTMLAALRALGRLTPMGTKTTVLLAPRSNVKSADIRDAIKANLDRSKGNAFYADLRTGNAFEIGVKTKFNWRQVN